MRAPRIVRVVSLTVVLAVLAAGPAQGDGTSAANSRASPLPRRAIRGGDPLFRPGAGAASTRSGGPDQGGACYLRTDQPEKALADFDRIQSHSLHFAGIFAPGFFTAASRLPEIPATGFAGEPGQPGYALLMLGRDPEALQSFQQAVYLWSLPGNQGRFASPSPRPDDPQPGRCL